MVMNKPLWGQGTFKDMVLLQKPKGVLKVLTYPRSYCAFPLHSGSGCSSLDMSPSNHPSGETADWVHRKSVDIALGWDGILPKMPISKRL